MKFPKKLNWCGYEYTFSSAKHNILVYISNPVYSWDANSSSIIVEFNEDVCEKCGRFYVLHHISANERGFIETYNLCKGERLAYEVK